MAVPLGRDDAVEAEPRQMLRGQALPQAQALAKIHDRMRSLTEKAKDLEPVRIGERAQHVGRLH